MLNKALINDDMIKTDLYEAVNGEFLKNLEIPADRSSIGGFAMIDIEIEKLLLEDSKNLPLDDEFVTEGMRSYLAFYRSILNNVNREITADHPVHDMIRKIQNISTKDELNAVLIELKEMGIDTLYVTGVDPSFTDSTLNILYVDVPGIILPAKEFYLDKEQKNKYIPIFRSVMLEIFEKFDVDNAEEVVDKAISLDEKIVEYVKTNEELADYIKNFNPVEKEKLLSYSDVIDFELFIKQCIKKDVQNISVTQPRFFENIGKVFSMDNLDEMKALILVDYLYSVSDLFDEELRVIKTKYANAITGIKEAMSLEKFAYKKSMELYSQIVGLYYGEKYFGEEAKKDIYDLVNKMIQMYKVRLQEKEWLADETKKKAILKLENIGLMLAYPDEVPAVFSKMTYCPDKTLYENYMDNIKYHVMDNVEKYGEKVDRDRWLMPASRVNAYYNPTQNQICFPAAILNEPFYSLKQSKSQNFGGIGAVIAHEISHAFDNNGANFDENGNLNNWWKEEDFSAFKDLTNRMIKQFEGLEIHGGKVNGTLVVSENLADVGGLACAIACAKEEADYNPQELFINWARIWSWKGSPEYATLLLKSDVHSPAKLRANMMPRNMDEFYEAFDIKEGDAMFMPKEDRIIVW